MLKFWKRLIAGPEPEDDEPATGGGAVPVTPSAAWPLERTLIHFRGGVWDARGQAQDAWIPWTLRDACEGGFVFGANGSGKTSGTGRHLAAAFLAAGMGGLVLCAKPNEATNWQKWANENGREQDLVIFSQEAGSGLNFLDYELRRPGRGGGQADAAADVLMELVGASEKRSGEDSVWKDSTRRLMRNGLDLCLLAQERPTMRLLFKLANDGKTAATLLERAKERTDLSSSQTEDLENVADYFGREWAEMDGRPKSSVMLTAGSLCDAFLQGVLRECFTKETTTTPEDAFAGKIIIVDIPQKEFGKAGEIAGVLWKFLFQRAVERRQSARGGRPGDGDRPTFLYADEAHFYLSRNDASFATTCRDARCATVYMTQNRPNVLRRMSQEDADSLMGCFQTKVFHQNGDRETNNWAADLAAKTLQSRQSSSASYQVGGQQGGQGSASTSNQEVLEHDLQPREFLELSKGGPEMRCVTTAILFQSGRVFPNGEIYAHVAFSQTNITI